MWRIRMFFRKIKNLIRWFPVIWKDEDWDDHYIFEILKFKLKNQAKYISNRDFHLSAKRDAEIMMLCTRLMDAIQNETYNCEYSDYHKTKYWFEDIEDTPGYKSMECELLEENFDDYFKKYPLVYKRVMNGEGVFNRENRENDKQLIAMNMSKINHDRARKLLFKILEQNIEKWWD